MMFRVIIRFCNIPHFRVKIVRDGDRDTPTQRVRKDRVWRRSINQPALENSATIVVASYNIRYAVGRFLISGGVFRKAGLAGNARRDQQVAGNIGSAARAFSEGRLLPRVDVLALQEADKRTKRAGGHHVARELAEAMLLDWVHLPAGIPRGVKPRTRQWWLDFEEPMELHETGDTGVGLMSRFPLSDVTRIDLPWHECAWRPRLAMAATVSAGDRKLRIFNAHVDPHAAVGGQLEQLEVLVQEADKHSGATLILGDFNTLSKKKVAETRSFWSHMATRRLFPQALQRGVAREFVCMLTGYSIVMWRSLNGEWLDH